MDISLDREKLISLASELAKDIKTEADLNALASRMASVVQTKTHAAIAAMATRQNGSRARMSR